MLNRFAILSTLNGSLNGHRYLFVVEAPKERAPKVPEQQNKTPGDAETPVCKTKVEGGTCVKQGVRQMDEDELEVRPRTPQEIAQHEKLAKAVEKAAPFLKGLGNYVAELTDTAPNQEQMAELLNQIKDEFSKNPDLAEQMTTQLLKIKVAHMAPSDFKGVLLPKIDKIFTNYSVDKNPTATRNEINRLGVDVHNLITQRDERARGEAISRK